MLTLGVPTLNFPASEFFREAAARPECRHAVSPSGGTFSNYADFFRALGYARIDALDISDYEGANIIGDLNDSGSLPRKISRADTT